MAYRMNEGPWYVVHHKDKVKLQKLFSRLEKAVNRLDRYRPKRKLRVASPRNLEYFFEDFDIGPKTKSDIEKMLQKPSIIRVEKIVEIFPNNVIANDIDMNSYTFSRIKRDFLVGSPRISYNSGKFAYWLLKMGYRRFRN